MKNECQKIMVINGLTLLKNDSECFHVPINLTTAAYWLSRLADEKVQW
jgi:hypothetical protein